jgi:hypothetical protein
LVCHDISFLSTDFNVHPNEQDGTKTKSVGNFTELKTVMTSQRERARAREREREGEGGVLYIQ